MFNRLKCFQTETKIWINPKRALEESIDSHFNSDAYVVRERCPKLIQLQVDKSIETFSKPHHISRGELRLLSIDRRANWTIIERFIVRPGVFCDLTTSIPLRPLPQSSIDDPTKEKMNVCSIRHSSYYSPFRIFAPIIGRGSVGRRLGTLMNHCLKNPERADSIPKFLIESI